MLLVLLSLTFLFAAEFPLNEASGCGTCSISYEIEVVGCYQDNNQRPLPTEILNERDSTRDTYDGNLVDWWNWNSYMEKFACRCATKANERGWTVFGLQFYGECWSGPEPIENLTMVESSKCVGNDYQPCDRSLHRHCVGEQFTNMVYRIILPDCDVNFERLGCYRDPHEQPRPLPDYILTDRDPSHNVYSGILIDWHNWKTYLPQFACRCAKKAREMNYTTFGLQYYGECWSGAQAVQTYYNRGPSDNCVNKCFEPCPSYNKFCVGKEHTNFVYRLSDAPCEFSLQAKGCFNKNTSISSTERVREIAPPNTLFNGHLLDNENWDKEFPKFLCRCARAAKQGGFTGFAVHNYGSCLTTNNVTNFYSDGGSSECFSNFQNQCASNETKCAGGPHTYFVYEIDHFPSAFQQYRALSQGFFIVNEPGSSTTCNVPLNPGDDKEP